MFVFFIIETHLGPSFYESKELHLLKTVIKDSLSGTQIHLVLSGRSLLTYIMFFTNFSLRTFHVEKIRIILLTHPINSSLICWCHICCYYNKSWQQHPTRHQLYGHLPPITKTIQVRRTRHAGHSWRSRDELIRDVLLWIPTHGRAKAGRPARTYIQQLCEDTGCCPEDLPRAMNDREEWRERVRDIRATSAI